MKDLKHILKILLLEKKDIVYSIICGFIAGITAVILFAASGYLISKAALTLSISTMLILAVSIKLLGMISAISRYGERYFSHRGTFTMLSNIRVSFYEKLEPLVPSVFHQYRSGDLLARIVGDVEAIQNFFLRVFYPPVVLLFVFFCTIFLTGLFSIEIALIIFIGFLLTTIIVPAFFALTLRKVDRQVRQKRGELSTGVTEFLYGFRDLKIHQQLEEKEVNLHQSIDDYIKEQERESVHNLYSQSTNTFVSLLITLLVLGVGVYLVAEGQLDGVFLAMFVMISITVFENTTSMAVFPSYLEESQQASSRLNTVVQKDVAQESTNEGIEEALVLGSHTIEWKNVTFAFPDETRDMLKNITLTIPAGTKTAIVGPSGSGKSTLLQLLLKFYSLNQGQIYFNNDSIDHLTQESIWKNTNVVLQENHFFYGTIQDNLQLAKDGISDAKMEEVLKVVNLGHFSLNDQVLEKGANLQVEKNNVWQSVGRCLKSPHYGY